MKETYATTHTKRALKLVSLFDVLFTDQDVDGYRPKLAAPAGLSTGGGEQGMQHVTLERAAEPPVTVGWINIAKGNGMLRNYERLVQIHELRHAERSFPLTKRSYADFFVKVAGFARKAGADVTIEKPTADPATPPSDAPPPKPARRSRRPIEEPQPSRRPWLLAAALLVLILVALIILW